MRRLLPLLILLTLLLAACGEATATNPPTSTPTKSLPTPSPTQPPHHKVNENVKIYAVWEITIQSVKAENERKGEYITELPSKQGYRFLILTILMKNASDFEQTIIKNNFSLTGANGEDEDLSLLGGLKQVPDHPVEAKGPALFELAYEIPKTQNTFTFNYKLESANANTPGPNLIVWDITAN